MHRDLDKLFRCRISPLQHVKQKAVRLTAHQGYHRRPRDFHRKGQNLVVRDTVDRLATVDPRMAKLVSLRYFGGRTLREAADDLGIAPRTADAWWAYARAWLAADLSRG